MIDLRLPLDKKKLLSLKAGDLVSISGLIYTARDQAHARLVELIAKKKRLPFKIKDAFIYYCGPTQTPKGKVIGSCGPTTSIRMDGFLEPLLKKGIQGMIGKGRRSIKAKRLIKKYKAVYFLAPSGCGAYLAKRIKNKKQVAFPDLGPEAILELKVDKFPSVVGIDASGKDIYQKGRKK